MKSPTRCPVCMPVSSRKKMTMPLKRPDMKVSRPVLNKTAANPSAKKSAAGFNTFEMACPGSI